MSWIKHRVVRLVAGALLLAGVAVGGVFIVQWAFREPVKSQAVYSGLTLLVAFLALVAGAGAVIIAVPGYVAWTKEQRKRPDMRFRLAIFDEASTPPERWIDEESERITVPGPDFVFRVNMRNEGDRVLRWAILNVVVLRECAIHAEKLRVAVGNNDEIVPGQNLTVNFVFIERDFPPGHHYLTDLRIEPPGRGDWPVLVVVEGDPPPRVARRVIVTTQAARGDATRWCPGWLWSVLRAHADRQDGT